MSDKLVMSRQTGATASLARSASRVAAAKTTQQDYEIGIVNEPDLLRERLTTFSSGSAATLFQRPGWLSSWYATVATAQKAEPLLVEVFVRDSGAHVMTLPLVRTEGNGLRRIEFADLGVTDYNAPILGQAAPSLREGAALLWQQIRKALPESDLIHFRKMPVSLKGRPNPLALLPGTHPSTCPGFSIAIPDDWELYLRSLAKKFRKELGRSLRLFETAGDTRFCRIENVEQAERVLRVMREQQRNRLEEKGYECALDEESYNRFYASLVAGGLKDGAVVLTALMAGDEPVAALLGTTDGSSFAMVRLSHAGGDWLRIGLGRLIIERTMHELHGQGCRHFDFTIGDYPYKLGFGVEPSPLLDLVSAESWRGKRRSAGDLAKARIKQAFGRMGITLVPKAVKERYREYHASV
jgi:CelD/BcsL family acetyltransferase involved in cellulose biosynthesis